MQPDNYEQVGAATAATAIPHVSIAVSAAASTAVGAATPAIDVT